MTRYEGPHDGCGVASRHDHCDCGILARYEVDGFMEMSYLFQMHHKSHAPSSGEKR